MFTQTIPSSKLINSNNTTLSKKIKTYLKYCML